MVGVAVVVEVGVDFNDVVVDVADGDPVKGTVEEVVSLSTLLLIEQCCVAIFTIQHFLQKPMFLLP